MAYWHPTAVAPSVSSEATTARDLARASSHRSAAGRARGGVVEKNKKEHNNNLSPLIILVAPPLPRRRRRPEPGHIFERGPQRDARAPLRIADAPRRLDF